MAKKIAKKPEMVTVSFDVYDNLLDRLAQLERENERYRGERYEHARLVQTLTQQLKARQDVEQAQATRIRELVSELHTERNHTAMQYIKRGLKMLVGRGF